MREIDDLVELMDRLRGEEGCPWDREQRPEDLRGYLLEEAYEVVEAIDGGEPDRLREELGDLLFQIVFLSRIHQEAARFTLRDVARDIAEKMRRRHPHVFGESTASTSAEVLRQWEEIKSKERAGVSGAGESSAIDGIPRSLPALLRAERLGAKTSRVGFDWPDPSGVVEKVDEEVAELKRAVAGETRERVEEEFGDLLFALANLARHLGVHAEGALQVANERFAGRFRWIESELRREGREVTSSSPEELDALWRRAKRSEA